eukprot:m.15177 g.15177  ORF g.15177 m.15177 type:complete len:357 (-) comp6622_c0_seq2:1144-2214(-)
MKKVDSMSLRCQTCQRCPHSFRRSLRPCSHGYKLLLRELPSRQPQPQLKHKEPAVGPNHAFTRTPSQHMPSRCSSSLEGCRAVPLAPGCSPRLMPRTPAPAMHTPSASATGTGTGSRVLQQPASPLAILLAGRAASRTCCTAFFKRHKPRVECRPPAMMSSLGYPRALSLTKRLWTGWTAPCARTRSRPARPSRSCLASTSSIQTASTPGSACTPRAPSAEQPSDGSRHTSPPPPHSLPSRDGVFEHRELLENKMHFENTLIQQKKTYLYEHKKYREGHHTQHEDHHDNNTRTLEQHWLGLKIGVFEHVVLVLLQLVNHSHCWPGRTRRCCCTRTLLVVFSVILHGVIFVLLCVRV